jgi:hypothetical protein
MRSDKFTEKAHEAIQGAAELASDHGQEAVEDLNGGDLNFTKAASAAPATSAAR